MCTLFPQCHTIHRKEINSYVDNIIRFSLRPYIILSFPQVPIHARVESNLSRGALPGYNWQISHQKNC